MSGVQLLIPDLLREIMLWLPCDIGLKFDVAQVCRYWRDIALHNYIFWSSISVCDTKSDCGRVPIALQRSGSTTMLHIEFWFTNGRTARDTWPASALTALVPYVARIEELDVDLASSYSDTLSFRAAEVLFNSNLEFFALKTLCLAGPDVGVTPRLSLKAPRLRFLDFDHIHPEDPNTLLVPSLEHIRFCESDLKSVETLSHIFTRCPRAGLVVLQSRDQRPSPTEEHFGALKVEGCQQPLVPALRELEFSGITSAGIARMLAAWFSDVVLPKVTACVEDLDIDLFTRALFAGVGPLIVFQAFNEESFEARDKDGHIRGIQYVNEDLTLPAHAVWEQLSIHCNLHRTVREIRITRCDDYIEIFKRFPPHLDEITLIIEADSTRRTDWPSSKVPTDISWSTCRELITKPIYIPGLAKLEFYGPKAYLRLAIVTHVLAHVELPTARTVEVCIGNRKLVGLGIEQDAFGAFQTALSGNSCWAICSRCLSRDEH